MEGVDWFFLLMVVLIVAAVGALIGNIIEFRTIHNPCVNHGFDGGGRDYSGETGDYPYVCWRTGQGDGEVWPLRWVLENCTGRGDCVFDDDVREAK